MGLWLSWKPHPVSVDLPKMKQISGDGAKAVSGVKPGDVDVPKVKTGCWSTEVWYWTELKRILKKAGLVRESSKFKQYAAKEYALAEEISIKTIGMSQY